MSSSLWLHGLQHTRLPCPSPTPSVAQIHVHWVSDVIQPSHPLSSPSPPAFNLAQHQGLVLHISWPKYWSFSFSISPSNEYSGHISFRIHWFELLAVQGTQESSTTPQFKSKNSLALSFLYTPTLTSTPEYGKNHSFDKMDLCQQSNVCFLIYCLGWS